MFMDITRLAQHFDCWHEIAEGHTTTTGWDSIKR